MPEHTAPKPVCHHCGGFPVVVITTGTRHLDGSRRTLRVICKACQGTGTRSACQQEAASRG
ncbi:hypothetical protein [Streptomyces sp. RK9]|uniref:hypothetical protein n=1 Tax=Streptomyces sp. RK9 TaxID=3239284 RepID=UPI003866F59A